MKNLQVFTGKINRRKVISVKKSDVAKNHWTDFDGNRINGEQMILSLLTQYQDDFLKP